MRKACVLVATLAPLLVCMSLIPAHATTQFDGKWMGALGAMDRGNCRGTGATNPVHDLVIEGGKLRSYDFTTRGGPLPLVGGFAPDGSFKAEGSQAGKGKVSFEAKAIGAKLAGRWSFEVPTTGVVVACSGPLEFTRQK